MSNKYASADTLSDIPEIENIKFRQLKFQLANGQWKNLRAHNHQALLKLLRRHNPKNAYYSVTQYLNPLRKEHPNYQIADGLVLKSTQIIDIDDNNLLNAKIKAQKVIEIKGQPNKIVYSGHKGYHLYYDDHKTTTTLNRRKEITKQKKRFIQGIEKYIDTNTCIDIDRVIRIPGTYHGTTGNKCTLISQWETLQSQEGNDQGTSKTRSAGFLLQEQTLKPDEGLGFQQPTRIGKFIRNKIEGTKDRYVFYGLYKTREYLEKDSQLLTEYGLTAQYKLFDGQTHALLEITATTKRKMDKIYSKSVSMNKRAWNKYGNLYIKTSHITTLRGEILEDAYTVTKQDSGSCVAVTSRPHNHFIRGISNIKVSDQSQCGLQQNNIYTTMMIGGTWQQKAQKE